MMVHQFERQENIDMLYHRDLAQDDLLTKEEYDRETLIRREELIAEINVKYISDDEEDDNDAGTREIGSGSQNPSKRTCQQRGSISRVSSNPKRSMLKPTAKYPKQTQSQIRSVSVGSRHASRGSEEDDNDLEMFPQPQVDLEVSLPPVPRKGKETMATTIGLTKLSGQDVNL